MDLQDLGWSAFFADAFARHEANGLIPARVAARHHGPCELLTEHGRLGGVPAGKLDDDDLPAVGDWVAVRPLDGERKAVIEAVLPRRTAFTRKEAWRRAVEQVVAANVDAVLLVTAFGADLSPRRIERYLTATWDSGADPVLVVNKLDTAGDPAGELARVETVALGVPVLAVSAATGAGLEALEPYLGRGRTVALLGSSGVGKTTLANRLMGGGRLATARRAPAVAAATRPRGATCSRCPAAGCCSTRPACASCSCGPTRRRSTRRSRRSPSWPWPAGSATARTSVSRDARSAAALADGSLDEERYTAWRKLQRELRALEIRRDARLRADRKREMKTMERSLRRYYGH